MITNSILDFLADLGANIPKNFETQPEIDEDVSLDHVLQSFANDTLRDKSRLHRSKMSKQSLVSVSSKGESIPACPGPFPREDNEPDILVLTKQRNV